MSEPNERFTNGKRRIATAEEVASQWGGGERLRCYLCNRDIQVGEGWRWVYMNSDPSPTFGNFNVCDACDGPDVKQRWIAANMPIWEYMKSRKHPEGDWPTAVVAGLQAQLHSAEQRIAVLTEALKRSGELIRDTIDGACCCDTRYHCDHCKEMASHSKSIDATLSHGEQPALKHEAPWCPSCGYTKEDAQLHGDHHLCNMAGKAPWETGTASTEAPKEQR